MPCRVVSCRVVQLYGFSKVHIKAGETVTVELYPSLADFTQARAPPRPTLLPRSVGKGGCGCRVGGGCGLSVAVSSTRNARIALAAQLSSGACVYMCVALRARL